MYQQLTGVTFAPPNSNCPGEVRGFAATTSQSTNLKSFQFNTTEHSTQLISGYVWNVLEDMHEKNWEGVGKPAVPKLISDNNA